MSTVQEDIEVVDSLPDFLKNTNINFDFFKIREDLKNYLKNQEQFQDYNFDASGLSILLDVLTYNSQMNAMTTHLAMNEVFLDSAQARANVVSAAKNLSYVPKSYTTSRAIINISLNPFTGTETPPFSTIPQGLTFSGGGYTWMTTAAYTAPNTNNIFLFENIEIVEGVKKTVRFYYDSRIDYQKFEIPDHNVDISTIKVRVKANDNSNTFQEYKKFTVFNEIDSNTPVYFLQENASGRYEVYFSGKESLGMSPINGNVVEVSYVYTNGADANGVSTFYVEDRMMESSEKVVITTQKRSYGGSYKESTESIRHNAPQHYKTQNRCVTTDDYVSIILRDYPGSIESITSWGGEYNIPPEFGRVFIAIKPKDADSLDDSQKQYIIDNIIKPRNVATIAPFIEDPDYVWIGLDCVVKYDETSTNNSSSRIEEMVRASIIKFGSKNLQQFERVFKHSRLLHAIDTTEISIQNSSANVYLIKKVNLLIGRPNQFLIKMPIDLYRPMADESLIRSSPIMINGRQHFLVDKKIVGNENQRRVSMVYLDAQGNTVIAQNNIGIMNLIDNTMYVYNLYTSVSGTLRIYFNPSSYDIPPFQNQFLRIDEQEISVKAEPDPFTSSGNFSLYKPAPRSI